MAESSTQTKDEMAQLFRPPINRAMRVLDKPFFRKTVPLSAARMLDPKQTAKFLKECADDILLPTNIPDLPHNLPKHVRDPEPERGGIGKLILMMPTVKPDDLSTVGPTTAEFVRQKILELLPYELQLTYDNWSYLQLMEAIVPEELLGDIAQGYTAAGHIAHFNLRAQWIPYKYMIGQMILDKNPRIRTVVNKLEDVGADSEFRTFPMEVLAGDHDTEVEVNANNCRYYFDFAKVYWNTRLEKEHARLVDKFLPGEAIADVMAGVGPFALPAAKKGCLVWANDLNPDSYDALKRNIRRNRVKLHVKPYRNDGRAFIRRAIPHLYRIHHDADSNPIVIPGTPATSLKSASRRVPERRIPVPKVFAHFVMNLPASAVEFLDGFIGAYRALPDEPGVESLPMPMVHVYTFVKLKPWDSEQAKQVAADNISRHLNHKMPLREIEFHEVRSVSTGKMMFCCSFRLPPEVAWADPPVRTPDEQELEQQKLEEFWLKWKSQDEE